MLRRHLQLPYKLETFNRYYFWPETLAAIAAFAMLAFEMGFEQGSFVEHHYFTVVEVALLIVLFIRVPVTYLFSSTMRTGFQRCGPESIWSVLCALGIAASLFDTSGAVLAGVDRGALLGVAVLRGVHALLTAQKTSISPIMLMAIVYSLLILIGAGLLMLPRATNEGVDVDFVNALFMSTSASCITGLSLYDVGEQFTRFGQIILLCLFQIGGLGIMTLAAFITIASGAGMTIRDRVAMGEVLNVEVVGTIGKLILWILGMTLAIEIAGVIFLYGNFVDNAGVALAPGEQLYYSIFHSVSAFCQAGFSLHTDSFVRYQGSIPVMLPMGMMIIIGGMGFTVVLDLFRYKPWRHPLVRRLPLIGKKFRHMPLPRLELQTKLVLWMTLGLTIFGSVVFWLLEHNNPETLAGLGTQNQVVGSFFQGGVTPRSSGFNTLDFSEMRVSTQFITILLMLIGASPGSTGGGIKTTSLAILLLALWKTFRGRPVEVFKRRISDEQVKRVLVMLVIALIVINSVVFVLTLTEEEVLAMENGFVTLTFEIISAFATVGLSMGATAKLTAVGKIILSLCMLAGRIGPLALVLAIGGDRPNKFDYPHESVMLG